MASMSGAHTTQADSVRGLISEVKQLTVDRLKSVLRGEGLQLSGLKTELQLRIIGHIHDCDRRNDQERLRRIGSTVRGLQPGSHALNFYSGTAYPSPYSNHTATPASSASPQYQTSPAPRAPSGNATMPNAGYPPSRVTFKTSPFYTIGKQLSNVLDLKPREQTRDTARITINLDDGLATKFQTDPASRAFVFCAAESYDSAWKPVEIAFPHHAELRVNQEEVKVNLKGLKNKPGSTRPVDITPFLRKKAGFPNNVELVYALTNKKYLLLVNMVQKKPIESLVDELKKGKYLSKDRVVREMRAIANDDDIVTTSSNMSLKDPVQMTRIQTPCRAMSCKHNDCFDAAVFLALQEQAPTWTCPICNKPAPWDTLVFDQYVQDILENTHYDIEQVTVEPDGRWHTIKTDEENGGRNPSANRDDSDNDDELVEITDLDSSKVITSIRTRPFTDSIRTPPINGHGSLLPPPPLLSSASLLSQSPQPNPSSKKRLREEVIDLTLSDDDDEPPVSRIKRPSFTSQTSDLNRPPGTGMTTGPYRFTLPPPVHRTDSPGNWSGYRGSSTDLPELQGDYYRPTYRDPFSPRF